MKGIHTEELSQQWGTYLASLGEWQDDAKMGAMMFMDFSENMKRCQPAQYTKRVDFWWNVVYGGCMELRECVVATEGLIRRCTRKGVAPREVLRTSLMEWKKSGQVVPFDVFVQPQGQDRAWWSEWLTQVMERLSLFSSSRDVTEERYVVVPVAKRLATKLYDTCIDRADLVITTRTLQREFSVDGDTLNALLAWLEREKKVCLFEYSTEKFVKFLDRAAASSVVTEADLGIGHLLVTMERLQTQVARLKGEIKQKEELARKALREGNRGEAKIHLARRKFLDTKFCKSWSAMLENLETVLMTIRNAQADNEVLVALQHGTQALRSFTKESGLTPERVEQVHEELAESLDFAQEINEALASAQRTLDVDQFDEEELEKELAVLCPDPSVLEFPSTPDTVPTSGTPSSHTAPRALLEA